MVQIKENEVYGVENPLPRSFLGGLLHLVISHPNRDFLNQELTQSWFASILLLDFPIEN